MQQSDSAHSSNSHKQATMMKPSLIAIIAFHCLILILARQAISAEPDSTPTDSAAQLTPVRLASAELNMQQALSRIALGSCFAPQLESGIWQSILHAQPDVFLYLGDNVYASEETDDTSLPYLREAYGLLAEVPGFNSLRQRVPIMVTWDDHDYGMNDAGASWVARTQAEALFEQVWAADDERAQRPGVYYARTIGPPGQRVQIIMLDTRYFRSELEPARPEDKARYGKYAPSHDPDKTMLGAAQWLWLKQQLAQAADLRFIVSSVAVVQDEHDMEGWRTLPEERRRLYDLIASEHANGVIFISGDRHFAGLYREEHGVPYPLTELSSSSLNLPISGDPRMRYQHEREPRKISDAYMDTNFGMIEIDWPHRQIQLQIVDEQGRVARSTSIDLDDLKANWQE